MSNLINIDKGYILTVHTVKYGLLHIVTNIKSLNNKSDLKALESIMSDKLNIKYTKPLTEIINFIAHINNNITVKCNGLSYDINTNSSGMVNCNALIVIDGKVQNINK